jgi:peptidoglycan/xylan/chitin deacetylase (PgdA/CDA1 family)
MTRLFILPVVVLISGACDNAVGQQYPPQDPTGTGGSGAGLAPGGEGGAPADVPVVPGGGGGAAPTAGDCAWPEGMAAVSLTYDDALPTQIAIVGPALAAHGLTGTFFLVDVSANPEPWRALREQGNELGAHTFNHPCQESNSWVVPGNASEDYDLARMAAELDQNVALLESLGQASPRTFAYPCGVTWVGQAHESYVGLVQERFIAARGVVAMPARENTDPFNVPAYFLTGTGAELIAVVTQAQQQAAWVVFGFHGVGGDVNAISQAAHEELLVFLEASRDTVYVAPFGTVAACLDAT